MLREKEYYHLTSETHKVLKFGYVNYYKTLDVEHFYTYQSDISVRRGHVRIVKLRYINSRDKLIDLITTAFQFNHFLCVKEFLSKLPSNVDITDVIHEWLQPVASNGNISLVELVKSRWPDTNINIVLPGAIESGHFKLVKYLISIGVNLFNEDNTENLSLLAVGSGNLPLVKYLIRLGLILDLENEDTLAEAVSGGNLDLVKYLVINLNCKVGDISLYTALQYVYLDIAQYLIELGLEIKNDTLKYITYRHEKFLTCALPFILSHKTFESSQLTKGLNDAISQRLHDVIDLLVKHGADLMTINKDYLSTSPTETINFLLQRESRLITLMASNPK
jgi:ankyrin repeat protein